MQVTGNGKVRVSIFTIFIHTNTMKSNKATVTCIISALEVCPESRRKSDHTLVTHLRLSARSNNLDPATGSI